MDADYYRYPVGTPEHYAAYEQEFWAYYGLGYPFPDDPRASYEVDNAYELAYDDLQYRGREEPREEDWETGDDAAGQEPYSSYADEHSDGVLPPADPDWPAPVRDSWEFFWQARARASELVSAAYQSAETETNPQAVYAAELGADRAVFEADTAYTRYISAWDRWRRCGPDMPAGHEEPEAGS